MWLAISGGQRQRKIPIPETWPWVPQLVACLLTVSLYPH
jgi:hypothetical protein